ncbi:hypothetical protein [Pseudovibrio sp. Tun.PSC04-5.I4]|uniref:hypothetical protein n=1 Tax=Pseudovibrio sp. Tun.PSC04-5.I4 TaxID=1798213 RepID=UPI0013563680|nr:hypothetical protein [Pseudovibrio sp. Tun.PSC04-5.I4]
MTIELRKLFPGAIPLFWGMTFRALIACLFAILISGCTSDPKKHAESCDYENLFENAVNQSGYSISNPNKDHLKVIVDLFFHELEINRCNKRSSFNYFDDDNLDYWQKFYGMKIIYYFRLKLLSNNDICLSGFRLNNQGAPSYPVYCKYKGWILSNRKSAK